MSPLLPRVLLVDDESHIISAYKRSLRTLRPQWDVRTASSGHDAIKQLEKHGFEAIVTDIAMKGMDGLDLLTTVQSLFPRMLRLVVSGIIDGGTLIEVRKIAHAHFIKPVPTAKLIEAIEALMQREAGTGGGGGGGSIQER